MKRLIKVGLTVGATLALIFGLTACDEDRALSVPQNFCGFVQGNGGLDSDRRVNDANVQQVLYQGQTAEFKSDQATGYVFPCNTRNYVVSDQSVSGDSHTPLAARTSEGIPVGGWVTLYWQPNQAKEPVRQFIAFCQGKYGCAATDASAFNGSGTENASTPGWNKMLAENVYPVLQRTFEASMAGVDNTIWSKQDPEKRNDVAADMSARFAAEFQKVTGSTTDLLCGSGSTGTGEQFDCKQVYVVVDAVWATQGNMQGDSAAAAERDAKNALDRESLQADLDLTNTKYGPLAPAYRACRDLNIAQAGACKFITGPGGAQVAVP